MPSRLLIETTQLMFHMLEGKGKKNQYVLQGVLYTKPGCVEIFIAHVEYRGSNLQPNKALFPWPLPQPGFWGKKQGNSLQKKPG
jgi:hypothetical protein